MAASSAMARRIGWYKSHSDLLVRQLQEGWRKTSRLQGRGAVSNPALPSIFLLQGRAEASASWGWVSKAGPVLVRKLTCV